MFKTFKALPILLTAPLLMANSAMPEPVTKEYQDLDVSINFVKKVTNEYHYETFEYEVDVDNVGQEYTMMTNLYCFSKDDDDTKPSTNLWFSTEGQVFMDQALAPGHKGKYIAHSDRTLKFDDSYIYQSEYYYIPLDVTINKPQIVKYKEENTYVLKLGAGSTSGLSCGLFVDVEYKGEDQCFFMRFVDNDHTFRTYRPLDLKQLTIKDVHAYKIHYIDTKSFEFNTFTIVLTAIIFLLIAGAILVPVFVVSHKKKRK